MPSLDLTNRTTFRSSVKAATLAALRQYYGPRFTSALSIKDTVYEDQGALRAYPNVNQLRLEPSPGEIITVPAKFVDGDPFVQRTIQSILSGGIITEHSAGGEATRLNADPQYKLGFKYHLGPILLATAVAAKHPDIYSAAAIDPNSLLNLSIGMRHMAQYAYDLTALAIQNNLNPSEVLKSQFMIITLNKKMEAETIDEFVRYNFFGFDPNKVMFMVDVLYPGMCITDKGEIDFNPKSDHRLYNHGHMVMQEAMENELFTVYIDPTTNETKRRSLSRLEVEAILDKMDAKVSYPIEDHDYLTSSLSLENLATAIRLGEQNYRMVAELLLQCTPPQKGGCWAFDPSPNMNRAVMVESDSGGNVITAERIRALNRNFNVFPRPADVFRELANNGLPFLHLMVTEGHIYLQPPQGDLNFLVKSAFVMREGVGPINSLKKLPDGIKTLRAMAAQDVQYGFIDFLRQMGLIGRHMDPKQP